MPRSATGAPAPSAYQRALRRLARRDHSVAELRRALAARGHEPDEVEAALERLRRERYLDDAGFAERFARSRLAHQGHGRALDPPGAAGGAACARSETEAGLAGALREVDEKAVARHAGAPLLAPARAGRARSAGCRGCGRSCCGAASPRGWCTSA